MLFQYRKLRISWDVSEIYINMSLWKAIVIICVDSEMMSYHKTKRYQKTESYHNTEGSLRPRTDDSVEGQKFCYSLTKVTLLKIFNAFLSELCFPKIDTKVISKSTKLMTLKFIILHFKCLFCILSIIVILFMTLLVCKCKINFVNFYKKLTL